MTTSVTFDSLPEAVRRWRPIHPGCTPETVTDPGARPCCFFDCPGLPEELQVICSDICLFDFAAEDGQVWCDQEICPEALRLKGNVETYRLWLKLIEAEAAQVD